VEAAERPGGVEGVQAPRVAGVCTIKWTSSERSRSWSEARRIWWEAYWRFLGKYRGGEPFFETYEVVGATVKLYAGSPEFVLRNIVFEDLRLIPPEVREYTFKPYRAILKA
jgi:hypothetical protein